MYIHAINNSGLVVLSIAIILISIGVFLLIVRSVILENRKNKEEKLNRVEGMRDKSALLTDVSYYISKYRNDGSFTLVMISLENIDDFIETFGRKESNKLTPKIAERLKDALPNYAITSRFTYDRFVIFIKHENENTSVSQICKDVIDSLKQPINLYGENSFELQISVAATIYPLHSTRLKGLLENLDMAIYVARKQGYNNFVVYSQNIKESETENVKYYQEIKEAIRKKEFTLYYQPIMDLSTQSVYGYESLLRWKHPEYGVLPPAKFINIMEQTGDIFWIGLWGFEELIKYYAEVKKYFPYQTFFASINVSPRQIYNMNFIDGIAKLAKKYRIDTSRFIFEFAEFTIFEKQEDIKRHIAALKNYGFKIAIDGMGIDTNILAKLDKAPIDIIKINRDFLRDYEDDPGMRNVVQMLVDFGRKFGKRIIIEGVENDKASTIAKDLSITLAQGYHFSPPISDEEMIRFISKTQGKTIDKTKEKVEEKNEA